MITVPCFRKSDTLKVFIIIIYIGICKDPPPDYDLAIKSDSDYFEYYFRPSSRYDQKKMDPVKFFSSKYILPNPKLDSNYKLYKQRFEDEDRKINLQELLNKSEDARIRETSPDYMDERYAFEDPEYSQVTDKKYYESEIYLTEYNIAKQYIVNTKRRAALSEDDYTNLWVLMPKSYETAEDFFRARAGLDDVTPESNIGSKIPIEYELDLVEVSAKDVLIKGEPYEWYAVRMAYLGKIPLHQDTCNEVYMTKYPDMEYTYDDVRLTFNPECLNRSNFSEREEPQAATLDKSDSSSSSSSSEEEKTKKKEKKKKKRSSSGRVLGKPYDD